VTGVVPSFVIRFSFVILIADFVIPQPPASAPHQNNSACSQRKFTSMARTTGGLALLTENQAVGAS
jgi:hypothetical protein